MIHQRKRFQCKQCSHIKSLTAGTVFHKLRNPLRVLFLVVYFIAASKKNGQQWNFAVNSVKGYKTAWLLIQKI